MKVHVFFEVGFWFGLGAVVAVLVSVVTLALVSKAVTAIAGWLGC